jgi:STE24 endopeptidase
MLHLARRVEARFSRPAPAIEDVLGAQLGATLIVLPTALAAALIVHGAARLTGNLWWIVAGVLLAIGMVAALHGGPGLLARLSGARPLTRPALVERLAALARRARVPIHSIDVVPDERGEATALVAGVGARRRVFLSSEMALNWSDDEIEVVVAHELAHHAHHDLWRTLALDALVMCAGLGAAGAVLDVAARWDWAPAVRDLEALPMVALIAGAVWLLATPVRHALSRAQERRADEFALSLTGAAEAFSTAVRRLGARHLAEERPSALTRWLHHRHPSVAERLALAETGGRPKETGRRGR